MLPLTVAGAESLYLLNRYIVLPGVEKAVIEGSILAGQEWDEAEAEVATIRRKVFNPVFDFVDKNEKAVYDWLTGKDSKEVEEVLDRVETKA